MLLIASLMTSCVNTNTTQKETHCSTNDSVYNKEFIPEHTYKGSLVPNQYFIHTCRNHKAYTMETSKYTYDFYNVGDIIK